MMIQTARASETMRGQDEIDLKDFAQYLHNISFDEALHRVRRMSWESVLASELLIGEEPQATPSPLKKAMNL